MRTTIATRLLVLCLALTVTAGLAVAITVVPSMLTDLLGSPLQAWLRSVTPVQMALLRGSLFALPAFSAAIAVIGGSIRTARTPKPPEEPRWSPANRADPFRTRSGHGA